MRLERWEQYGWRRSWISAYTKEGNSAGESEGKASVARELKSDGGSLLLLLTAAADDDADDGLGREMARANDDECPPYGKNRTADRGRRVSRHFWQR